MARSARYKPGTHYARNRERILARMKDYYERTSAMNAPWRKCLSAAKHRAKKRGIKFNLTPGWAEKHYTGKCAVTGMEFVRSRGKSGWGSYSPTIDRINNNCGYTRRNCRFVIGAVNAMKASGTDLEMYRIAKAIVDKQPPKKAG